MPLPPKSRTKLRVNHHLLSLVLRDLVDGPCTAAELVDSTGLHVTSIWSLLRCLHGQRLIYVADHLLQNGVRVRSYAWGPDTPDKRFRCMTGAERQRQSRQRKKRQAALVQTALTLVASPCVAAVQCAAVPPNLPKGHRA